MTVSDTVSDLAGRNVLILGLGVLGGGIGMARHLAARGARLRISDLRTADQLGPALEALRGVDAEYVLGEHRDTDVRWADLVVRNPAVRPDSPLLRLARDLGTPVEMELSYFVRQCSARLTAVTGTKGKTTTTTLLHQLLRSGGDDAHLAGNMGVPAVPLLDRLTSSEHVLLEISAQQLEARAEEGWSPDVAVITNVEDDHLERYGSMAAYRQVKASLARGQGPDGWTILPAWDRALAALCAATPARKAFVADPDRPFAVDLEHDAVVRVDADRITWTAGDSDPTTLCQLAAFPLPGRHNRANLAFAVAAAHVSGCAPEDIAGTVPSLRSPEHRMHHITTWKGIRFVDDTAATAPIAVAATLDALAEESIVLIGGGTDKGSDFTPMVDAVVRSETAVVLLPGSGTDAIADLLARRADPVPDQVSTMTEAVARAVEVAQDRGATCVVLSPGCASFGLFRNEFERGRAFAEAVHALNRP